MKTQKIGILGLGRMGRAVGENLLKDGYKVVAVERPSTRDFAAVGGSLVASAAELARHCDIVISCLPHEESMQEAFEGNDGLIEGAGPGLIVVEMGTFAVSLKRPLAEKLAAKGAVMLDCPISGTPSMTVNRQCVLFCSGDKALVDKCQDIFDSFSPKNFYVGDFGCGMAIKLVTNFLVGVNSMAVAEAFLLGMNAGLDPEMMIKVIGPSAGGSRVFDFRAPMVAQRKFRPAPGPAHILWKDLQFIKEMSEGLGLPGPLLGTTYDWFKKMIDLGKQDDEVAAIFEVMEAEKTPAGKS